MRQYFTLKDNLKINQVKELHPHVMMIFFTMVSWANKNSLPVVVTSMIRTPEENMAVGSKSQTHVQGRAIDISVRGGWNEFNLKELQDYLESLPHIMEVAAISSKDLKPKPMIYHKVKGGAYHIHLQSRW